MVGIVLYETGNYEKAHQDLTKCIEFNPNKKNYYNQRGILIYIQEIFHFTQEINRKPLMITQQLYNYHLLMKIIILIEVSNQPYNRKYINKFGTVFTCNQ
ncbi:hypothetical protein FGO68_gene7755 [Halteria grandinella]|uniref:Tetratricopeptide repeat protein n=1 Tax=Halteria grandinella TaxID=5974 RepID=A0A8J8NG94_HALGN|nr:hypothetical protein FGO68_gene7755 [Halteria grandinella]